MVVVEWRLSSINHDFRSEKEVFFVKKKPHFLGEKKESSFCVDTMTRGLKYLGTTKRTNINFTCQCSDDWWSMLLLWQTSFIHYVCSRRKATAPSGKKTCFWDVCPPGITIIKKNKNRLCAEREIKNEVTKVPFWGDFFHLGENNVSTTSRTTTTAATTTATTTTTRILWPAAMALNAAKLPGQSNHVH